jgi:hypothetical protein
MSAIGTERRSWFTLFVEISNKVMMTVITNRIPYVTRVRVGILELLLDWSAAMGAD